MSDRNLHVDGESLEDWVAKELDSNPERVAVAEAEHVLAPMRCRECGRDLTGWRRASDPGGLVRPGEYIEMVFITPEDLGRRAYECSECVNEPCGRCKPEWVWPTNWPHPGCCGCPRIPKEIVRG